MTARSDARARGAAAVGLLAVVLVAAPSYAAPGDPGEAPSEGSSAAPEQTTPPPPAAACDQPPQAAPMFDKVPWTVSSIDPSQRIWPYSKGKGVKVAVVSTGVNLAYPELAGRVTPGFDFVRNTSDGMNDCTGQGTAIASIIAAAPSQASGFVGLAPDATIMPARVGEKEQVVPTTDKAIAPSTVASGITWAADNGASVIVVAAVVFTDDPALSAAVTAAQAKGAVIVAAVGDDHPKEEPASQQPTPAERTPYPAAYDGVIGIGAVGLNGVRVANSEVGPYVDLVAPGEDVIAASPGGGHTAYSGTAIASAFGGAAVTLLLGQPGQPWAQGSGKERSLAVEQRLRATASPVSGHFGQEGYGAGLVDASRALTDLSNAEAAASATPYAPPVLSDEEKAHAAFEKSGRSRAIGWTWGAMGALVAGCLGFVMMRRVRANDGRAVQSSALPEPERDQELRFVPGEQLFAPPPEPK